MEISRWVPTTGHEWKRAKPRRGAGMAARDFRRFNTDNVMNQGLSQ